MVEGKAVNADCSGEPLRCEISLNLELVATLRFHKKMRSKTECGLPFRVYT